MLGHASVADPMKRDKPKYMLRFRLNVAANGRTACLAGDINPRTYSSGFKSLAFYKLVPFPR